MTPVQARGQRVVAPGTRAPGRPVRRTQLSCQFGQRGSPQAIGDQFERQRKPARLTADAARKHQLLGSRLHSHPRHGGPGIKQPHRLRRNRMAGLDGKIHRLYPPHTFRLDIERDAARHQNPQIRGLAWPADRKHRAPVPERVHSCRAPAATGNPTPPRRQHQGPPPPRPPGSRPPRPRRQQPAPRSGMAPDRRSTPAPPARPILRSMPPQSPAQSYRLPRRPSASPPGTGQAWQQPPPGLRSSRQTRTASVAAAPHGPGRHHRHDRSTGRGPPPPANRNAPLRSQPSKQDASGGKGARCLEIGGGRGSVTRWLAELVGPSGRVISTDLQVDFLEALELPNVEVLRHDIRVDEFPEASFGLVRTRAVLMHVLVDPGLSSRMVSWLRLGGWLLLEEPGLVRSPRPLTAADQGGGVHPRRVTSLMRGKPQSAPPFTASPDATTDGEGPWSWITQSSPRLSSQPATSKPASKRGRRCSAQARHSPAAASNSLHPGQADFAIFKTADIEIGLTSLPWVDGPLVMLDTDDIVESRRAFVKAGAVGLGEIHDGSLAPLGTAPVTNGDPDTGVVDVPGARLAVVQLADGSKLGLRQSLPTAW